MSSSEVIRKHDVAALSPTKKRRPELSPVAPVALAPETILGEPWVALRWVRLGNNGVPRNQQREEGDSQTARPSLRPAGQERAHHASRWIAALPTQGLNQDFGTINKNNALPGLEWVTTIGCGRASAHAGALTLG